VTEIRRCPFRFEVVSWARSGEEPAPVYDRGRKSDTDDSHVQQFNYTTCAAYRSYLASFGYFLYVSLVLPALLVSFETPTNMLCVLYNLGENLLSMTAFLYRFLETLFLEMVDLSCYIGDVWPVVTMNRSL
jgi:hypothetical protein